MMYTRIPRPLFSLSAVSLMLAGLLISSPLRGVMLPQEHDWQVTLRNYLATLTEADFEVELQPLTWDEEYFEDPETIARYWMLSMEGQRDMPGTSGIRNHPRHFTLEAIETEEGIRFNPYRGGLMNPFPLSWWAQWNYPGNPYYGNEALHRRAFVGAAVDMMMLDQEHINGRFRRSDYLGGSMIRFGYAWYVIKDSFPPEVQEAFEAGLIRQFEKLEQWTPRGSGGSDMEFFQMVGMYYAAQALGGDFPERALARARHVLEKVTSDTGYELHGGAFDVSYQGIALRFFTWAITLFEDPVLKEGLHRMLVLKAYLSIPEPDGVLYGPTHFSTGTHMDAPRDQWAWVSRDVAMAMIDDLALYTVFTRVGVPSIETLQQQIERVFTGFRTDEPMDQAPEIWKENHWERGLNFAHEYYPEGFYDRLVALKEADSPLMHPPFGRPDNFIVDLNDGGEFLAAKFDDYGVVIHTGAIARRWATGVSGKSGGTLSTFWTPRRGSAILGLGRATQGSQSDEWTDENERGPLTWGVHAITGKTGSGHYFSTSRISGIESDYEIEGTTRAVVTVNGDLSGSWGDPEKQFESSTPYRRVFTLEADGLRIESELQLPEGVVVEELYEMLPVFYRDRRRDSVPPEILLYIDGDWVEGEESPRKTDRIRLNRYGEGVEIRLDQPLTVKLSPDLGAQSHGASSIRNLLIDLTGEAAGSVSYRIVPVLED